MASSHHVPPQADDQVSVQRSSSSSTSTAKTVDHSDVDEDQRPAAFGSGLSTTTVVGVLLGAAAGAALTYSFVTNSQDSSKTPAAAQRQPPRGQTLPRRATFPERPVTGRDSPRRVPSDRPSTKGYSMPRRLPQLEYRSLPIRAGYIEGDEDVEYGIDPYPSRPQMSQASSSKKQPIHSHAPSTIIAKEVVEPLRKHRASSKHGNDRSSHSRARSEVAQERVPLAPAEDVDRGSTASARRRVPGSEVSRPPLARSHRINLEYDHESFVSARSQRSGTAQRQAEKEELRYPVHASTPMSTPRSHASARTSRTRSIAPRVRSSSHISARRVPLPGSVAGSSHTPWGPWDVPLPMSGVGSSHAAWDDDMRSLAPSDSISCVGESSGRRRRRHS